MSDRPQVKVYLVRRLGWEYGDDFYYRNQDADAPMTCYLDPARAEAERRELNYAYARDHGVNPFGYVDESLEGRSSLQPAELYGRLADAGLTFGDQPHCGDVWDQYDGLPEEGKRRVWDALDRLCFYEVVEMAVDLEG